MQKLSSAASVLEKRQSLNITNQFTRKKVTNRVLREKTSVYYIFHCSYNNLLHWRIAGEKADKYLK